jgi:phosphopantothenoylcysteine decarboxylase / phosphopantothenate---cysteine ligase
MTNTSPNQKSVLLVISGSIAAYKSLDLIRRLRERGVGVRCILTKGGEQFITPLSVASLSGEQVYTDLWSLKDEAEMGHIRLTREADLVLIAPASADLIAKLVQGRADDLASATLLASNKPLLVAPAMNTQMWQHPATQRNIAQLVADGAHIISPDAGMLACGEVGAGRMAELETILTAVEDALSDKQKPLAGINALVTSGPTQEPIDPVRFVGNRSSGKQGHAIASALARAGANVTLVSGPTSLPDPANVRVLHVRTAEQMLSACERSLSVDIAVFAAAVADWRVSKPSAHKLKKSEMHGVVDLHFIENPDILAHVSQLKEGRPKLVVGFAAETDDVLKNATEKFKRKGCDWLLANEVGEDIAFGEDENRMTFITRAGHEAWPHMSKNAIAQKLAQNIISHFTNKVPAHD